MPDAAPGYGWPLGARTWVNPSPNAPNLWMARCYPGSVMLEGTTLSEGRGTTRPLELLGAPRSRCAGTVGGDALARARLDAWLPAAAVLFRAHLSQARRQALHWHPGSRRRCRLLRPRGIQALATVCARIQSAAAAAAGLSHLARFPYEYEKDRLAIDVINGSDLLRRWVDDPQALPGDLDALASSDEAAWREARATALLY